MMGIVKLTYNRLKMKNKKKKTIMVKYLVVNIKRRESITTIKKTLLAFGILERRNVYLLQPFIKGLRSFVQSDNHEDYKNNLTVVVSKKESYTTFQNILSTI